MKMWKLSHTDVCGSGERQTMSHIMTCGDAPNCTWADLDIPMGVVYLTVAIMDSTKKNSQHGASGEDDVGEEDGVEVDVRPSQVQQPGDLV